MITLTWTWERPWRNIKIYQESKLIGSIADFKAGTVNTIFQSKIVVESQGTFGQHIYFVDPTDNKAYCKYNFDKIVSDKRTCEIVGSTLYEVSQVDPRNSLKPLIHLKIKRSFFEYWKNSGEIIVHDSNNLSIDIFIIFYHFNFARVYDAS